MISTAQSLGYKMPAEWEPHEAVWLAWPHDLDSFPNINKVEKTYAEIISAIHTSERVELLVLDEIMKAHTEESLKASSVDLSKIRFHICGYADVWFRDYGPTFVVNRARRKLGMVKWIFNSWGNKYPELLKDNNIPYFMQKTLKARFFEPGIVLEGGSIEVNGSGTMITTEQCLLNPNRNPNLSRQDLENYLRDYLGVTNIIWLKQGIAGDDTDGHIDDIARFVNQNTVLAAYEGDESDENYLILKENYDILTSARDEQERPFKVVKLPMPKLTRPDGSRLPASYANFYVGNGKVLVPTFNQENDSKALEIIMRQFPGRKVAGIECSDLISGNGTLHCASLQQPAV